MKLRYWSLFLSPRSYDKVVATFVGAKPWRNPYRTHNKRLRNYFSGSFPRQLRDVGAGGAKGVMPPQILADQLTLFTHGFYADIWNQRQVQQYKSCLKSFFYRILVVLKYHKRLWVNIFDKDISRCINTFIKVVCLAYRCLCLRYWLIGINGTSKLPNFYRNDFKHNLKCCIWRWFETST